MSPLRAEVRKLAGLATPVVIASVGTMLMGVVDTVLLGRLSVEALAAASLGNVWVWGTFLFAQGVLFGLDPLIAQAHGAGDGRACALALQRGVVAALVLAVGLGGLWLLAEDFLRLSGQDPRLAADAHRFVAVQVPSAPCLLVFAALRQYLQCREIVRPAMWVVAIANVFNAVLAWALIFGELGLPALGLVGAGIATAATRAFMLALLFGLVIAFRLHEGAWTPWSRAAFDPRALARIARIGLPVAVQMGFEVWAFSASSLIAGRISPTALAAHTVALNLASFAFMFPLGVSQGTATRVGNLIGAGRHADAQRAAWVSIALGAGTMLVWATTFALGRAWLPRIYTTDADVIALSALILPIAAAFAVFDGTQVVGCAILRGMGDTRPAARYNLLGYWILGLPLGAWLALRADLGLAGIWWGLAFGLALVALLLIRRVRLRGPATLAAAPGAPHPRDAFASGPWSP
jgi:MATE family multidrug resistance protein